VMWCGVVWCGAVWYLKSSISHIIIVEQGEKRDDKLAR
jgi:hypothetical protein